MINKLFLSLFFPLTLFTTLTADEYESSFREYKRTWIGADYWPNRLRDWRETMGRLECLNGGADKPLRTTHWLTGKISDKKVPFTIEVRPGSLGTTKGLMGQAGANEHDSPVLA